MVGSNNKKSTHGKIEKKNPKPGRGQFQPPCSPFGFILVTTGFSFPLFAADKPREKNSRNNR